MKLNAAVEIIFDPKISLEERTLVYIFLNKPDSPPCISFFHGEEEIKFNFFNNTLKRKDFHALFEALRIAGRMTSKTK